MAAVPTLREVHDRVHIARNDIASAKALISNNQLGVNRLDAALDLLDGLLRDLESRGLPTSGWSR